MSIYVYYTEIAPQVTLDVYHKLQQSFPEKIKEKIQHYNSDRERQLRIASKALLVHALKELDVYPRVSLEHYGYSPAHQPILVGSDLVFSLSHSGNIALCAITSGRKLGVDIEKVKPVRLELMKFYFDPVPWQAIINAHDTNLTFHQYWTMREATIKASGHAIEPMELSEITIEDNVTQLRNETYYSRILSLPHDYIASIASDQEIIDFELSEIALESLL